MQAMSIMSPDTEEAPQLLGLGSDGQSTDSPSTTVPPTPEEATAASFDQSEVRKVQSSQ